MAAKLSARRVRCLIMNAALRKSNFTASNSTAKRAENHAARSRGKGRAPYRMKKGKARESVVIAYPTSPTRPVSGIVKILHNFCMGRTRQKAGFSVLGRKYPILGAVLRWGHKTLKAVGVGIHHPPLWRGIKMPQTLFVTL